MVAQCNGLSFPAAEPRAKVCRFVHWAAGIVAARGFLFVRRGWKAAEPQPSRRP